jgi:hypothetical protein
LFYSGELQWVVKEKITAYGQNLILFCPIENCCSEPAGWFVGPKLTILDVRTFSNDPKVKYHGTYNSSIISDMNERSRSVNSSNDLSMSSIGSPTAAYSPKCKQRNPVNPDLSMLRTLTINFQSIKNKVPDLHALIDSAQPHVIIGRKHGSLRTCIHLNFFRMSMK